MLRLYFLLIVLYLSHYIKIAQYIDVAHIAKK